MTGQSHSNDNPDVHLVKDELREGLETSRLLVRQSRYLIELSQCDSAPLGDDRDCALAN